VNDRGRGLAAGHDQETRHAIAGGAMLYDASLTGQAQDAIFEHGYWLQHGQLEHVAGGRGSVLFLREGERRWVLRHYRRGGAVARLLGDRYLYTGEDRTRAFREWRLLGVLTGLGLPVPRPVAARYRRRGLFYSADLLTGELPSRLTLARLLAEGPLPDGRWHDTGRCVGAFHAQGVRHADLNAHNIVLGPGTAVYLLDFDRGRIVPRGAWEDAVLARLQRSLWKLTRNLPGDRFGPAQWQHLLAGCRTD
jgi:3-deoxy-D-manno-octulosonic acid kinase